MTACKEQRETFALCNDRFRGMISQTATSPGSSAGPVLPEPRRGVAQSSRLRPAVMNAASPGSSAGPVLPDPGEALHRVPGCGLL